MIYRAVKDNSSNLVLAIGRDDEQGGQDYNGLGTWCDFTFNSIPSKSGENWHHEVSGESIIIVDD